MAHHRYNPSRTKLRLATASATDTDSVKEGDCPYMCSHDHPETAQAPISSITNRLNDAYHNDSLEPQEREFLDLTQYHFGRLPTED